MSLQPDLNAQHIPLNKINETPPLPHPTGLVRRRILLWSLRDGRRGYHGHLIFTLVVPGHGHCLSPNKPNHENERRNMNDAPVQPEVSVNEYLQSSGGSIDIRDKIRMLARSFPCLGRKLEQRWQWDAPGLEKMSRKWSTGERRCAMFVLSVWNPGNFGKKFDFQDFAGTLQGSEEMEAFIDWCRFPWWP